MKRILPSGLMVLCLLFLPTMERTFADEAKELDLSSLKWQMLQKSVSKTDLGPGLPEVAILVVSNDQFEKIHASEDAAKAYLDSQRIFKKKLIKAVFCNVEASKDGTSWILIISHTVYSTASIVAWEIPKSGYEK